jgi:hypothetical protein
LALTYDTNLLAWWIQSAKWDSNFDQLVKGYYIAPGQTSGYPVSLSSSDLNAKTNPNFGAYGIADSRGKVVTLEMTANIDGNMVNFRNSAIFNIQKPGKSIWNGPSPVQDLPNQFQVKVTVTPAQMDPEIPYALIGAIASWKTSRPGTLAGYEGQISWVQLVRGWSDAYVDISNPSGPGYEYMLDNVYPYSVGVLEPDDRPTRGAPEAHHVFIRYAFKDWLMWKPPGTDSIAVPIQRWEWFIWAQANWDSTTRKWTPSSVPGATRTFSGTDTNNFPCWSHLWTNPHG